MTFKETKIQGGYVVEIEAISDHRGFFARQWCANEFERQGMNAKVVQVNLQFSVRRGTIRGLHFQMPPHAEVKLVRCTRGSVLDVMVDLRPGSSTHRQWVAVELSSENHVMLCVPEGCAHGYQTLTNDAEVTYQTTQFYTPETASGVRYNDPAFGILWPLPVSAISSQDERWPDYPA